MIRLLGKFPKDSFYVAVSGGIDSMFAYDFMNNGRHICLPLFFNHGTETSQKAMEFLNRKFGSGWHYGNIHGSKPKGKSWEEFWRDERYKFFHGIKQQIVTAHHLNDQIETWVWSSMHGNPKLIPYNNKNVIRPFLMTPKIEIEKWVSKKKVEWIEDESNKDVKYQRNRIRQNMMPEILKINPGIGTVISKKVLKQYNDSHTGVTK